MKHGEPLTDHDDVIGLGTQPMNYVRQHHKYSTGYERVTNALATPSLSEYAILR